MIRLEHVNLVVKQIDASLKFYAAAFPHWRVRGKGADTWNGQPREWLHFGDDYQYLTLNEPGVGKNRDLSTLTLGLAHFGYVCEDLTGVIERLAQRGFVPHRPRTDESFRSNVYFLDPDGLEVEFVQYHSDIPTLRNQYS